MRHALTTCLAVLALGLLAACDDHAHEHGDGHDHDHDHAGHVHEAPHGGTLVVLGETAAHVEVRVDATSGKLTLNLLGSHASAAQRSAAESIVVEVTPEGGEAFTVETKPVANALSGETVGDTSQFEGRHDGLKGLERFQGRIPSVSVMGGTFSDVTFPFPEGHESSHGPEDHDHDEHADHDHEGDGHDHDH